MKSNKRFIPTLVFFAFIIIAISVAAFCITSSAKDENKYYSPTGLEIHGAIPIERTEWFDFTDFSDEVVADGETDMTQMLQACVNEHDNILLPSGRYYIAGTVTLRDGSGIKGEDGTVIVNDNNDIFFACGSYDGDSGILDHASDISITDFKVESTSTERSFLLNAYGIKNVEIRNIHLEGCGILQVLSNVPNLAYILRDEAGEYINLLSQNVTVSDCFCDGIDQTHRDIMVGYHKIPVGMQLEYLYDFIIERTEVCRLAHGIQYFGGYSALQGGDEHLEEHRLQVGKLGRCVIADCNVHDISGGAIWGTTVDDFLLTDTVMERAYDCTIDFESSDNVLITKCKIVDGPVGGSHSAMGTIIYRDNEFVITENHSRNMFNVHGSDDTDYGWEHQKLIFEDNTFTAYGDHIGTLNATHYNNPAIGYFIIRNNKLVNTVVRSCTHYPFGYADYQERINEADIRHLYVQNNDFYFTNIPNTAEHPAAIYVMSGAKSVPVTDIIIEGNTFDASFDTYFDAVNVNNNETLDSYHTVIRNNTAKRGVIRVLNCITEEENDKSCSAVIENNICNAYAIEGNVSFIVKSNKNTSGKAVTADDMAITKLYSTPEKSAKNTVDSHQTVKYLSHGITNYGKYVWMGSEEYKLSKSFSKDSTAVGVKGSFKTLWYENGSSISLCFLIDMIKSEKITTKDIALLQFSLDGKTVDGTVLVRSSGTFKTPEGRMFEGTDANVTVVTSFSDKYTRDRLLVTLKLPESIIENRDNIRFNLSLCENSRTEMGVGFVCAASETDASKFAALNLRDGITRISFGNEQAGDVNGDGRISRADLTLAKEFFDGYNPENGLFKTSVACGIDVNGDGKLDGDDITALEALVGDALSGDVNGDGKIKGNDSTLLLKYLAGWSVSIEEANADCNCDGKIKGNDSTLLLKYLAGWDVSLG